MLLFLSLPRSPWSNKYDPPLGDGAVPSDRLRKLEIEANQAFDTYREMYFESGICSVYLWDLDHGFAGVVLIKKGEISCCFLLLFLWVLFICLFVIILVGVIHLFVVILVLVCYCYLHHRLCTTNRTNNSIIVIIINYSSPPFERPPQGAYRRQSFKRGGLSYEGGGAIYNLACISTKQKWSDVRGGLPSRGVSQKGEYCIL